MFLQLIEPTRRFVSEKIVTIGLAAMLASAGGLAHAQNGQALPIATEVGATVLLDPTDGADLTGLPDLRAEWSWQEIPPISTASFSDAAALRPSVTIDVEGRYVARLEFFDVADTSSSTVLASTTVEISTIGVTPVARIVGRSLSDPESTFILDGSDSFDMDGDRLTYEWTVSAEPSAGEATITDAAGILTEVTFGAQGAYEFALIVEDFTGLRSLAATYDIEISGEASGGATPEYDLQASLGTFNLITPKYFGRQEVEGRTYIGSTISNVTGQFGYDAQADGLDLPELAIDGNIWNSIVNLTPGDVAKISGGKINSHVNNGTLIELATDLPAIDFSVYEDQSAFLATLTGEVANVQDQNNKKFGGAPNAVLTEANFGPNTRIVNTRMQDLQTGGYSIDVSTSDTVIINVSGSGGQFQMNPLGGTGSAENVLWNFYEATNINVNSVIMGHILAPYAKMSGFSGSSEGSVIAKEIELTNGELHQRSWYGTAPTPLDASEPARNVAPVADLGFDQLPLSAIPFIDVHQSSDLDGDLLTASFQVGFGDATSQSEDDGRIAVTPAQSAAVLIEAAVADEDGAASDQILAVTAGGALRPVARIGGAQAIVGQALTLDGSQSYDFNGDILSYEWSLISAPASSAASIQDDGPFASFTPDVDGQYIFQLIAHDGVVSSVPATLLVDTSAALPIANAGADVLADSGGLGTPDGGQSQSASPIFEWTLVDLADDAGAAVSNETTATPTVQLAADGGGGFASTVGQLVVSDVNGISRPDAALVTDGQVAPVLTSAEVTGPAGVATTFLASDYATDANGDALTHEWALLHKPDGSAATVDASDPTALLVAGDTLSFTSDSPGLYLLQLTSRDASLLGQPVVIALTASNLPPVAQAAPIADVFVGEAATLDGAGSFDPNGNALDYSWSIVTAPAGSTAVIDNPIAAVTTFTPDIRGAYVFQLQVSDLELSDSVTVGLNIPNRTPVAALDGPVSISVSDEAEYSALGSTDPDGEALTYSLSAVGGSGPDAFELVELSPGVFGFAALESGQFTLTLTTSDGDADDTI